MRTWKHFVAALLALVLGGTVACYSQTEKLLCNKWLFSSATLTDRAVYVAYVNDLIRAEAKKQGMPQGRLEAFLQQTDGEITETSIANNLQNSSMTFRDDHSLVVSFKTIHAAGTWLLDGKRLALTTKAATSEAQQSVQEFEISSISKSQMVLTGHGLTQVFVTVE
jgi:membrane-bound lytic murein transglycosylase B